MVSWFVARNTHWTIFSAHEFARRALPADLSTIGSLYRHGKIVKFSIHARCHYSGVRCFTFFSGNTRSRDH